MERTAVEEQKIADILAHAKGTESDMAAAAFSVYSSLASEQKSAFLRRVSELWGSYESDETVSVPVFFSKQRIDQLRRDVGPVADKMLEALIARNLAEDDFYVQCVALVDNPFFSLEPDQRAFVFYWLLVDKRIPYFRVEAGLHMSDADYAATRRRLRLAILKLRFVVSIDSEQRTITASRALRTLRYEDSGAERPVSDQAVLMAALLEENGRRQSALAQLLKLLPSSALGA